jgi:hypothetical protein
MKEELKNEEVNTYLAEVTNHVLDNLDDFKELSAPLLAFPFVPPPRERDPFLEYEVNVVVNNATTVGAPSSSRARPRISICLAPSTGSSIALAASLQTLPGSSRGHFCGRTAAI